MTRPFGAARGPLGDVKNGGGAMARTASPKRQRASEKNAPTVRGVRLPELLWDLFWSYRFDDVRLPDSQDLAMLYVLTYGRPTQKAWLRRRFKDDGIRLWIVKRSGKGLTVAQFQSEPLETADVSPTLETVTQLARASRSIRSSVPHRRSVSPSTSPSYRLQGAPRRSLTA